MNFPQHVQELLEKRYFLKGEAYKNYYGHEGSEKWEDLCNRVAKVVSANNPVNETDYYNMLSRCEFLPNSPTLFGAGVPGLCLSACFVAPMQDSIEGWANTLKAAMKIQTAGGGIGFPLHKLRPSGFPVRGKIAKAAGPIEFMRCWNQISLSFRQAVRNGANMGQLHISHPNVEEFISCKDKDGELSAFNISVMIDDKFMDAVAKNNTYDLVWEGKVIKTVKARELWNKIIEHAWKTGEPGIIFFDAYQRSFPHTEEVYANPCLHGDTLILTDNGFERIKNLVGKKFMTMDHLGNDCEVTKVWSNGIKKCIRLVINGYNNGSLKEIICTPDHELLTEDLKWTKAKDCLGKKLRFVEPWGFPQHETSTEVISIEDFGECEVFDFKQPESSSGCIQGGYIAHNCGEANIPQNGACNLGSINLMTCVFQDGNNKSYFDFSKFKTLICNSYVFLDDLIDVNTYPTKEIDETVKKYRQIGLGVMGLADVFLRLGIRYGSAESLDLTQKIMSYKSAMELEMNKALAKKRGHYPAFKENRKDKGGRLTWLRNASTSCVAPTGSLSMIAGVSAGIEPVFSFEPVTRVIDGVKKELFAPFKTGNTKIDVDANHVTPEEHIKVLAVCQDYTNMSISKTINLPNSATVEDVRNAYELAYTLGTKCVTVYRDGCRSNQTIQTSDTKKVYNVEPVKNKVIEPKLDSILPVKRSGILTGKTFKDKIACGNLYTTINFDSHGDMLEVFVRPGKNGGCGSNVEAIARLLSMSLRSGVKISEIVNQLKGIRCPACMAKKEHLKFTSCADSISRAIEFSAKHKQDLIDNKMKIKEAEEKLEAQDKKLLSSAGKFLGLTVKEEDRLLKRLDAFSNEAFTPRCPECNSPIVMESGCRSCKSCGWSRCG